MPWLTAWRLWPHLNCCDEEVVPVDGPALQFLEKITTVVMGWWVLVFWVRRFSLFFAAKGVSPSASLVSNIFGYTDGTLSLPCLLDHHLKDNQ